MHARAFLPTSRTQIQPEDRHTTDTVATPTRMPDQRPSPVPAYAAPAPAIRTRSHPVKDYSSRYRWPRPRRSAELMTMTSTRTLPTHTPSIRVPCSRGCLRVRRIDHPTPTQEGRDGCAGRSTGLHRAHRTTDIDLWMLRLDSHHTINTTAIHTTIPPLRNPVLLLPVTSTSCQTDGATKAHTELVPPACNARVSNTAASG